jgi:hypothetical protein
MPVRSADWHPKKTPQQNLVTILLPAEMVRVPAHFFRGTRKEWQGGRQNPAGEPEFLAGPWNVWHFAGRYNTDVIQAVEPSLVAGASDLSGVLSVGVYGKDRTGARAQ